MVRTQVLQENRAYCWRERNNTHVFRARAIAVLKFAKNSFQITTAPIFLLIIYKINLGYKLFLPTSCEVDIHGEEKNSEEKTGSEENREEESSSEEKGILLLLLLPLINRRYRDATPSLLLLLFSLQES